MKKTIALLLASSLFFVGAFANIKLPKIFGDNMVLQRNKPISIWGWATANEKISIQFNKQTKTTIANQSGKWQMMLSPESAGGPYNLKIVGNNKIIINNILVGEVWVCSGQSNMEMPIAGWGKINNYQAEIDAANFPQIRQFKVPNTVSTTLKDDFTGGDWKICSPATAGDFSAAAYFFARQLFNQLKVPIGLINTSWGGTQSEAWTSEKAFEESPQLKYIATAMKSSDIETTIKNRGEILVKKIKNLQGNYDGQVNTSQWTNSDFDDSKWPVMKLPNLWESQGLADLDGTVWFRKTINITDGDAGKAAILELSMIDDVDETYINGVKVGTSTAYNVPRKYAIEAGILKAGNNTIAIKVGDSGGGGGVYGNANDMKLTIANNTQTLAGDWKFQVAATTQATLTLGPNDYPSLLFNAMLNPLLPYTIKGAIWYQGETNAGRAYQYRTAFPLMITDWRKHFKQGDFPFLFVQLSTFGSAEANSKNGSNWAELREAQSMTLKLPNTGMAVTTDIGNPKDIHPKNKQDVGKRLASIALHDVYKIQGEYTGPTYQSMTIDKDKLVLTFTHTSNVNIVRDDNGIIKGFEIAGADKQFYPAKAIPKGNQIIVSSDQVKAPVAARYNWVDDASGGNLFNKEMFPAGPFRTDTWDGITVKRKYEIGK